LDVSGGSDPPERGTTLENLLIVGAVALLIGVYLGVRLSLLASECQVKPPQDSGLADELEKLTTLVEILQEPSPRPRASKPSKREK
jgi:hypothetical protein